MVRLTSAATAAAFALVLAGVVAVGRHSFATGTQANEAQLLTGFAAKESCSCVFTVQQTDAYCTNFAQIPPYTVDVAIDHAGQTVTATALGTSRTARAGAAGTGCALDPL
jgi:hypothetical protein